MESAPAPAPNLQTNAEGEFVLNEAQAANMNKSFVEQFGEHEDLHLLKAGDTSRSNEMPVMPGQVEDIMAKMNAANDARATALLDKGVELSDLERGDAEPTPKKPAPERVTSDAVRDPGAEEFSPLDSTAALPSDSEARPEPELRAIDADGPLFGDTSDLDAAEAAAHRGAGEPMPEPAEAVDSAGDVLGHHLIDEIEASLAKPLGELRDDIIGGSMDGSTLVRELNDEQLDQVVARLEGFKHDLAGPGEGKPDDRARTVSVLSHVLGNIRDARTARAAEPAVDARAEQPWDFVDGSGAASEADDAPEPNPDAEFPWEGLVAPEAGQEMTEAERAEYLRMARGEEADVPSDPTEWDLDEVRKAAGAAAERDEGTEVSPAEGATVDEAYPEDRDHLINPFSPFDYGPDSTLTVSLEAALNDFLAAPLEVKARIVRGWVQDQESGGLDDIIEYMNDDDLELMATVYEDLLADMGFDFDTEGEMSPEEEALNTELGAVNAVLMARLNGSAERRILNGSLLEDEEPGDDPALWESFDSDGPEWPQTGIPGEPNELQGPAKLRDLMFNPNGFFGKRIHKFMDRYDQAMDDFRNRTPEQKRKDRIKYGAGVLAGLAIGASIFAVTNDSEGGPDQGDGTEQVSDDDNEWGSGNDTDGSGDGIGGIWGNLGERIGDAVQEAREAAEGNLPSDDELKQRMETALEQEGPRNAGEGETPWDDAAEAGVTYDQILVVADAALEKFNELTGSNFVRHTDDGMFWTTPDGDKTGSVIDPEQYRQYTQILEAEIAASQAADNS